jgi:hypothetical protein
MKRRRLMPAVASGLLVMLVLVVACSNGQFTQHDFRGGDPPVTLNNAAAVPSTSPTRELLPTAVAPPIVAADEPQAIPEHTPDSQEVPPVAAPMPASPLVPPEPHAHDDIVLNGDPGWNLAIRTLDDGYVGVVTSNELNIRAQPGIDAGIVGTTYERHTVVVYELIFTDGDGYQWYRIGDDRYVSAWYVEPFQAPEPLETYPGHWVDVNLSSFYAIAYIDETPVYAAIIAAGRDGRTPTGEYHVFYRVRSETMDSATIGIPEDDPEYYYLEDVEYTQYFKDDGFAIHGNYWTPPSEFGQFTSNGCVGLLNADAARFWDFLEEGSMINIHF